MELINQFKQILEEKQAVNIKVLNISEISSLGDYFIIATAKNESHIDALTDYLAELAKPANIEGLKKDGWVLLDFGNIIVHIFNEENRNFYNLERLWVDAKEIL
ncbi:MAG: ribosome silencing factor [Defluviitaleaceae bacterium]|nr:ribosome silencing factor [Defluviitaleaceae bacterium]